MNPFEGEVVRVVEIGMSYVEQCEILALSDGCARLLGLMFECKAHSEVECSYEKASEELCSLSYFEQMVDR